MHTIDNDQWLEIIGLSRTSVRLLGFLESRNIKLDHSETHIKKLPNSTTYYNIYSQGIALCFINDKIDSIDFYSADPKFKSIDESVVTLPFGIEKSYTGKTLVKKFGEPLEKGGGFSQKMDIWMRWDRFQVDIDDRSWETANNAKWKSITLF